ncbi:hypothetical protein C5610_07460 [Idiomarina sp. OT37-5b]|uniref:hypothetical protein n=1 Tax=Idiomarina sp. OT37-5b TaxID=2100422 RepID=UPI000CF9B801|nr:hypothetical protein [Idiomarina sp. OT37-5b]AVJ56161.1 hypothetical protein C5610_07460 [Idiomarina sp. OT37-5b]
MSLIKKVALILLAAGATFALIVTSVIVYQYTAMEPPLPNDTDCSMQRLLQTEENAAEIHHYYCQRGSNKSWQGHELWLVEPASDRWQRMLTTTSPQCLQLTLERQTLHVAHDGDKGEMNLAEPVFIYKDLNGQSQTLAVDIDNQPNASCRSD